MFAPDLLPEEAAALTARCSCPSATGEVLATPGCAGEGFFEVDTQTAFLFLKPGETVPWCRCLIVYGASRLCSCSNRVSLFRKHGI